LVSKKNIHVLDYIIKNVIMGAFVFLKKIDFMLKEKNLEILKEI